MRPLGIRKIEKICTKLDSGVGFSYGWEALAFTYPPPLVPSILIATWEAIGPCTMVCDSTTCFSVTGFPFSSLTGCPWASIFGASTVIGSISLALSYGLKFWIIPWETRKTA